MSEKTQNKEKAGKVFGMILFILMLALTGVVIYLWMQNYQTLQDTRQQLEEVLSTQNSAINKMSVNYQQDKSKLQTEADQHLHTKAMLAQSQQLLDAAKLESKVLADRIAMLETKSAEQKAKNEGLTKQSLELAKTIGSLKAKNTAVEKEIYVLQEKLAEYNTDVATITDGKAMIRFFKSKIHEVKKSVHSIRRKTQLAKEEAQREIDHLEYIAGNNGYVKKDGVWAPPTPEPISKTGVNIDVKFIQ